jgi:hypothetical protein
MLSETKICKFCNLDLPLDRFYYTPKGGVRYGGRCKKCYSKNVMKMCYEPNKEKWLARTKLSNKANGYKHQKAYDLKNREREYLSQSIRCKCKTGTLSKPSNCPICGSDGPLNLHIIDVNLKTYLFRCKKCHNEKRIN